MRVRVGVSVRVRVVWMVRTALADDEADAFLVDAKLDPVTLRLDLVRVWG